jgi:VCBS repeat-containing protein
LNDGGDADPFLNSIGIGAGDEFYIVPMTLGSVGGLTYQADCYDLAIDQMVTATYLKPIITTQTQDCQAGTATVTINGGMPEFDGSQFTADMAIQNVIGDSFRGATWVSIHNGGGVGWGEVINGGFGMVLDGTQEAEANLRNMLFYDVNNGIARRSWARNKEATFAIKREMKRSPNLIVTLPNLVEDTILNNLF